MLIDWFTVGAQAVNFVVLLWLMKRFLYKPILTAIDAREKRIADELADAAQQQAGAEILRLDLLAKTQAFEAGRESSLAQAITDAGVEHDRLATEARSAAEATRQNWQAQWQRDRAAQSDRLDRMVTDEVFAIARQALRDLSGAGLEERMAATLLTRLREMPPDATKLWLAALETAAPAVVRSRYALEAPSRTLIQTAINDSCSLTVPLRFEPASDDVDGIEIIAAGQRIAWTITDYLHPLKGGVEALARESTTPAGATKPALALALAS